MASLDAIFWAVITSFLLPLLAFVLALVLLPLVVAALRLGLLPVRIFVSLFRGTPLIAQLFVVYYGLPEFALIRETWVWHAFGNAYFCVVLVFALNAAAHLAYHFYLQASALEQSLRPAARALHFSNREYWRFLAMPRMWSLSQGVLRQELIQLFKAGSLCSLVAVADFTSLTKDYLTNTLDPFGAYTMAMVFYFLSVFAIQKLWRTHNLV